MQAAQVSQVHPPHLETDAEVASTEHLRCVSARSRGTPEVQTHVQTQPDDVCLARQYIVGRVGRQQPADTKRVALALVPRFVTRIASIPTHAFVRSAPPRPSRPSSGARILRCRPPIRVHQYAPTLEISRSFAGCVKITRTLPQQSIFKSSCCSSSDGYSRGCRCRRCPSMPST